jgi:hypothetical protein
MVSGGTCCCPEKSHGDEGFLRNVFLVQLMKVKTAAGPPESSSQEPPTLFPARREHPKWNFYFIFEFVRLAYSKTYQSQTAASQPRAILSFFIMQGDKTVRCFR